jgi:hypothetical protein
MKRIFIISASLLLLVVVMFVSYSRWNSASPSKTCASCHEISHSVDLWAESTHRNIACKDCHGTALSEGMHSLKEKGAMLFHHSGKTKPENVIISEAQRMEVMKRCIGCHQTEYARWNSGGHAINYSEVFLNSVHNKAETINDDCLRCHGMFYDKGTVVNIVEPLDTAGPWKLKDVSLRSSCNSLFCLPPDTSAGLSRNKTESRNTCFPSLFKDEKNTFLILLQTR